MQVEYTSKFVHTYKKLPDFIKILAKEKECVFRKDPFDPQLRVHKLKGKFDRYWSFSVSYEYRIIFYFTKKNTALFHLIGRHSVYNHII